MDRGMGTLVLFCLLIMLIGVVVYVIVIAALAIASVAAAGGALWGGGWAVLNYGKSIKKNLIDSNRGSHTIEL